MSKEEIFFEIAKEVEKVATSRGDKRRAFDAAQVSLNSYLIGTALSGMRSLQRITVAIDELTKRVFDPGVLSQLDPKDAIRLLDRALELYKAQVDVARQVSRETDWDRLAGLITEMRLYEEAADKGIDDDLIRSIAEELAARLEPDLAEKVKKSVKKVKVKRKKKDNE